MTVFPDNDVVLKLAACDLLDAFLAAMRVGLDEVRINSTARFQISRATSKQDRAAIYGDAGLERAARFVDSVEDVELEGRHASEFRMLQMHQDIDDGEATLVCATDSFRESRLVTGDKRFIRALAILDGAGEIRRRLEGRMLCLEQAVLICIHRLGFVEVRRRVVPGMGCDKALRSAFGSGERSEEAAVRSALRAYIHALRLESGSLLHEIGAE